MTSLIRYRPEAVDDVVSAYDWYEAERPGLGEEFRDALTDAELLLARTPETFPIVHRDLRRLLLHRFPYSIYFSVNDEGIEIKGCIHQARHPRTWRSRGAPRPPTP